MSRNDSLAFDVSRRDFIRAAVVATAATTTAVQTELCHTAEPVLESIIDTNVSLGEWPFRHLSVANTTSLVAKLRNQGISQAWAGSLDALLHKDVSSVNARLVEQCQQHGDGMLIPIGAINPMLPGWEEDLRRCVDVHRMNGIRLHPNYHGYKLDDPLFERVLQLASERNLLVQIAVIMEDDRTIHRLVNVPPTDTALLPSVLKKFPKMRLQLVNALRTLRGPPLVSLAAEGVCFEISMLEGVTGVEKLFEQIPLTSLCFGSYAPVFYPESARLKLTESVLAGVQMKALCSENARRLINGS